jgi:uncharacterized protein
MKSKISIITLGVENLYNSTEFYKKLGFQLATEDDIENIAFFFVEGSAAGLALFPKEKLAEDATVSSTGSGFAGFTLAHCVSSPEEVEKTLREAETAGAKIVKPGQKVFWGGYSGYFSDPDGFLWEIAYNPFIDLT